MVHVCNGVLFGHEKEQEKAICSNMDGPKDGHTEWTRERQMTSHEILEKSLFTRQKESHQ